LETRPDGRFSGATIAPLNFFYLRDPAISNWFIGQRLRRSRRFPPFPQQDSITACGTSFVDPDLTEQEPQAAEDEKEKKMMEQLRLSGFM
jgi:hypothetical protein